MKTLAVVCLSLLAALLSILPCVDAHGYVTKFTVDGTSYVGNVPNGQTKASPIRQISTIDPVKGATNPNLSCGQNAQKASMVVDANPGSSISFAWGDPYGSGWPHNTGPLMTYMASCGSVTCDKFDASTAQWFKIAEAGLKSNGQWYQQDIMNGSPYTTSIPANLASGQYLIRHEIIALHLAMTQGGAEFYPSCTQVNVKGSGTGVPPANSLMSFPGAYKDTDPGILDPNVYTPGAKYTFPGLSVVSLGSSSASVSSGTPSSPSTSSTRVPSPSAPANNSASSSSSPSPSSGSCSLTPKQKTGRSVEEKEGSTQNGVDLSRPRHRSRVMRRLYHNSPS